MMRRALWMVVALWWAAPVSAQTLTRGPYWQSGSSTGMSVRWRTDVASDSRVRYGSAPGSLTQIVDDPTPTTEHIVALSGLTADTPYYYSIGTTTTVLAGDDADHVVTTAPTTGTAKNTRVWVIGDAGFANPLQLAMRNAFEAFTGTRNPDLWLMLGDNAYLLGTDDQYQAAVFDRFPRELRSSVVWPTFGNHEAVSAASPTQSGVYYDIFSLPTLGEAGGEPSGTEAYYSFDYGNIHFICLNSMDISRAPGDAMETWLEADLAATTAKWVIAFWHHPAYSKGSHNSDTEIELMEMRQNLVPVLEGYGVDLVLAGHSHAYERSYLLDGHYGLSTTLTDAMLLDIGDGSPTGNGTYGKSSAAMAPHEGAIYVTAGSSCQASGGPLNHPAMHVSFNEVGSLVLDINGDTLVGTFINSSGVTRDEFHLVKGVAQCAPTPSTGCRTAVMSSLTYVNRDEDKRDKLTWKWARGQATDTAEWGSPATTTDYALCLYANGGLLHESRIPAAPQWVDADGRGFNYKDELLIQSGLKRAVLRSGGTDKARAILSATGVRLPDLSVPLTAPVVVQLHNNTTSLCLESTFAIADIKANADGKFKAKAR